MSHPRPAFSTALTVTAMSFPMMASAQDCTPADITLASQADIDDFQSSHGPCDHVTGKMRIGGEDILSLSGLSALQEAGNLFIEDNPMLVDCQGIVTLIDPKDDFEPGPGPGISNIPDIFGVVPIERITLDNVSLCYLLNAESESEAARQ